MPTAAMPAVNKVSTRSPSVNAFRAMAVRAAWLVVARSSPTKVGNATFTIVLSTTIRSSERHSAAKMRHRRGLASR